MSRQWTENQRLAINARGGSLLVSAAAGSGKTAVLVERVIQMVCDSESPIPIERLLIVTYTRAAAAELKERISNALNGKIKDNPDDKWCHRQLVYLPRAHISTVDSFCGDLVREFFYKLNVSSDYRIASDGELSVLKAEAMEKTLGCFYSLQSAEFAELVEAFATTRDDSGLESNILKLYSFLRSHPFEERWLNSKLAYYTQFRNAADSVWGKVVIDYATSAADYCIDVTKSSLNMLSDEAQLYSFVSPLLCADLQYLVNLKEKLSSGTWDEISEFADTFVTGKLIAKGYTSHPLKLKVADNRTTVKKTIEKIRALFSQREEDINADICVQIPIAQQMFECVKEFHKNYSDIKLQKNIADFSDVVYWALSLLVSCDEEGNVNPTEISKIVSERFDAVMVDEFQDANEAQDLIFHSVSGGGRNLFVVGDVKQSIYGFRQAMPEIFLSRKNSLPLYNETKDSYPAKVILERNFRSRKEVTDFINYSFSSLMSEQIGDMEYTSEEHLVPSAPYDEAKSPCNELHLLDLSEDEDADATVSEARYISNLILKKCSDTYIKDGDTKRLLRFGDIAIIMRNKSSYGDVYASELIRCGVPAVCETASGFLTSLEIMIAVNFLRVIDNPLQDIPLLSVLMSPVYGFTPDDLAQLRADSRKLPLYLSLKDYAQKGSLKAQKFISETEALRNLSLTLPADLFISALYEQTSLVSVLSAGATQRVTDNLHLLTEYAASFENGGSRGISSFVAYIDKLTKTKTDLPAAAVSNADSENVVRVMTIHSSKGLEFPLCIIANTARQFKSETKNNVLLHSKLGFASKRRDMNLMCSYSTLPRDAAALEVKRSEMSEEIRVLYVAMTRAKEQLVMVTTKNKMQDYVTKLSANVASNGRLTPFVIRDSRYLSDWILMLALLHPCGKNLREYASMDEPAEFLCEDTGNFAVIISDDIQKGTKKSQSAVSQKIIYEDVPENVYDVIKARFDFNEYSHKALTTLPSKVTASQLAHKETKNIFSRILSRPVFLSEQPLSAAQKGTAMHTFMQHCDFKSARENLLAEIDRLVLSKRLSPLEAESLDIEKLGRFLQSDIITIALRASEYVREYRFTVNIPASFVTEDIDNAHADYPVILQGAVDLAIISDDGIIIVDYKTDKVKTIAELSQLYKKQLLLYKYALQEITGKSVKSCLIYSTHLCESLEVL